MEKLSIYDKTEDMCHSNGSCYCSGQCKNNFKVNQLYKVICHKLEYPDIGLTISTHDIKEEADDKAKSLNETTDMNEFYIVMKS